MSLKDCMVHYNYNSVQKYIENILDIYFEGIFEVVKERKRKEGRVGERKVHEGGNKNDFLSLALDLEKCARQ